MTDIKDAQRAWAERAAALANQTLALFNDGTISATVPNRTPTTRQL